MAVPSNPTIAAIVTEALKRAGRTTPSATQISDVTEHQFREVKTEINLSGGLAPELLKSSVVGMALGGSEYDWPTDAQEIASIQLIEYPETGNYRSTCTAGATFNVTLASGLDITLRDIQGRYIFMVAGTSAGSYGQVVSWDNSTKVAVIDTSLGWQGAGVIPVSGDTYVLESGRCKIWDRDRLWRDTERVPHSLGIPYTVYMHGRRAQFLPTPVSLYPIFWKYWANLDYLDEAGTVFLRHLRSYRHLWIQGVAVKCMQRYDEDRYMTEMGVYQNMLVAYGSLASTVGQTIFRDV